MAEVRSTTKRALPLRAARVSEIASAILGARYDLSVAFVGRRAARAANLRSRGKGYVPNVLSFPLSKTEGEILICQDLLGREMRAFDLGSEANAAVFLLVHGCLHLKGLDHGAAMERAEDRWLSKFCR